MVRHRPNRALFNPVSHPNSLSRCAGVCSPSITIDYLSQVRYKTPRARDAMPQGTPSPGATTAIILSIAFSIIIISLAIACACNCWRLSSTKRRRARVIEVEVLPLYNNVRAVPSLPPHLHLPFPPPAPLPLTPPLCSPCPPLYPPLVHSFVSRFPPVPPPKTTTITATITTKKKRKEKRKTREDRKGKERERKHKGRMQYLPTHKEWNDDGRRSAEVGCGVVDARGRGVGYVHSYNSGPRRDVVVRVPERILRR